MTVDHAEFELQRSLTNRSAFQRSFCRAIMDMDVDEVDIRVPSGTQLFDEHLPAKSSAEEQALAAQYVTVGDVVSAETGFLR